MVLQKQCNLRQCNNTMTDCIRLTQLVRFLNQTIYKLKLAAGTPPQNKSSFFAIAPCFNCIKNKCLTSFLKHFFVCKLT